jgi:hypothetical protein
MSSCGDLLGKPLMDFSEIIRFHPLDDGDDIADLIFDDNRTNSWFAASDIPVAERYKRISCSN